MGDFSTTRQTVVILPRQVIAIPLHATAAVLSNHLVHNHVCSSLAFPRSSAALKTMLIKQWNSNNLQGEISFLVAIFILSTLLQYATNKHCMLLHGRELTTK